ncbi:PorV/PorQ family protein [Porifericola rhodea]|uniref:putative type IX sorting system protein PorV2 n=1 Tax=Porifericola rhodea TaxID=930972 RepID=UPI002666AE1C|nr:PorV/PorQ family protein [Porifericola rhodea]WKN32729.1 PorV/PorQ family protein [Porifericola rhodea]
MRWVLVVIGLSLLTVDSYGQLNTPKYSNEFLSIGAGARALGMAATQTAVADDVTSGFWNPASLTDLSHDYEVSLMHAEYFAGIANYDYGSFATPLDSLSTLAISVVRFAVDDIPDTRFLYDANGRIDYNNIRFFSAADYAFLFSYAREFSRIQGLSLGANFKVVHRTVGDFANAWGFGLDAAATYRINDWRFGLMLHDVTGTFNAWTHNSELVSDVYTQTGNVIPANTIEVTLPKASLGIARSWRFWESKIGLLTAADLDFTFDGKRNVLLKSDFSSVDPSLGLEVDYKQLAFVRLGAGNVQQLKDFDGSTYRSFQPDFGLGFRAGSISVDYALTDIGDRSESLYSHVFSLKFSIDREAKQ